MKNPINAEVLLREVGRVLKNDILPSVEPDKKYALLMCINAVEISCRSLSANEADAQEWIKISNTIREGKYDNADDQAFMSLLEALGELNDKELKISSPKSSRKQNA